MTLLLSSPPAKVASAELRVTVMVMGFSKVVSVDRSKALPLAVKPVGRMGISATVRST